MIPKTAKTKHGARNQSLRHAFSGFKPDSDDT
jgi:hypothetical protein